MKKEEKCEYVDKGFSKNKDKCMKKHPLSDCNGQCEDKRTCVKHHRFTSTNRSSCVYLSSKLI